MDQPTPSLRRLRIANAVFFFLSGFGYSSWASRIPSMQYKLHLNEAQLGAVLFALPIGLMMTMPLTGRLLGRFNSRSILLIGVLIFNVMLGFAGFSSQTWQLVAILFCFGSARNLFNISLNAQAVGVQGLFQRSIMTTFHGIWSLAGFAGAGLGYLMVNYNVYTSWHLLAVSIAMTITTFLAYPYLLHDKPTPSNEKKPLFSLPDKHLLNFSFICFASMACENTMYDWSGIYFRKAVGTSKAEATAAFAVYMIAMTTGRFAGDRIVGRFGIKSLLRISGVLICSGLLLAAIVPYPLVAGAGFIAVGLGVSCIVPLVFSMAGKSTTMSSGPALAAISTVGYLGFLIVPPLVGFVAQVLSLRWSFGIIGLLGALIVYLVSRIGREQPGEPPVAATPIQVVPGA
ncbi:MFS transporter [Dinghuibacter silviterrae]|uniref:Fucose permease n=1 Tax=Dinghuibacter silviterrae TaxID=1539049 RepID=A0A4R8DEY9_9BACT|nr:MFS transporter [Dinghuibacter silviterrae]TDW96139.1 fucose permease [Dinghuibacter silviterrae]